MQAGGLPPQTALPLQQSCRQQRPDASGQGQRAFTILADPLAHGEAPLLVRGSRAPRVPMYPVGGQDLQGAPRRVSD